MTITEARLAEIEARLKAATPAFESEEFWCNLLRDAHNKWDGAPCDMERPAHGFPGWNGKDWQDGIFIAHSPTDIADLLAEVRRLRKETKNVLNDPAMRAAYLNQFGER